MHYVKNFFFNDKIAMLVNCSFVTKESPLLFALAVLSFSDFLEVFSNWSSKVSVPAATR